MKKRSPIHFLMFSFSFFSFSVSLSLCASNARVLNRLRGKPVRLTLIFCPYNDRRSTRKMKNVLGKIYSKDDIEEIMFGIRCTTKKFHISLRLDFRFNIHSNTTNYSEQKQRSNQLTVGKNVYKHVH